MSNITTVVFDLSEVLLQGLLGSVIELQKTITDKDSDFDLKIPELEELFKGYISEESYFTALNKRYNSNTSTELLKDIVRRGFSEIPKVRDIVVSLGQKHKLGLLSEHSREWISFCEEKFRFEGLFDSVIYSYDMGLSKTDTDIYFKILQSLDADPKDALFIDDSQENVKLASNLGFKTILFESADKLKLNLSKMGINIYD